MKQGCTSNIVTMATAVNKLTLVKSEMWQSYLFDLPPLSDTMIDYFIKGRKAVQVTSEKTYKFYLEGYIHSVEGTGVSLKLLPSQAQLAAYLSLLFSKFTLYNYYLSFFLDLS